MIPRRTDQIDTIASVLTEAFTGDPFMMWVFDDPDTHVASLATWWSFMTAGAPEGAEFWQGDDTTADPTAASVTTSAMWYPPRLSRDEPGAARQHGDRASRAHDDDEGAANGETDVVTDADEDPNPFVEMMAALVGDRLPEVLTMFGQIVNAHPDQPHWYLAAVGTRVVAQGRGHGQRVLQPMLDRCDEQGLAAYLESSNPRNVPFYHRLGFEITGELYTPDDAAVMTLMERRPR